MTLNSPCFSPGAPIPPKHSCSGEDLSPELNWSGPPEGTRSFALEMNDPDAPAGTWIHWVLWNIPGSARSLEGGLPRLSLLKDGSRQGLAYGVKNFTKIGYYGPCPPSGTHRYFFKLYALDSLLDLGHPSDVFTLRKAMQSHLLDEAELMGTFKR